MPLPKCVRVLEDDTQSREALEADGWRYVETLVEMKRATEPIFVPSVSVWDGDLAVISSLAEEHMGPNRLVMDGKETLAKDLRHQIIDGTTEDILVIIEDEDHQKKVRGYLVQNKGRIVILAGPGYGEDLVRQFIGNSYRDGFSEVTAGTQETNHKARSLYGRLGFRTYRRRVTYHKD